MVEQFFETLPLNKSLVDKWVITFPPPLALKNIDNTFISNTPIGEKIVTSGMFFMQLENVNIPRVSVPSKEAPYSGQVLKISSHARDAYESLTFKFSIDNRFSNYFYIYKWLDILNDEGNSTFDFKQITLNSYKFDQATNQNILQMMNQYMTSASVVPLDEYGNPIIYFNFNGLFPTSLSTLELDFQDSTKIVCTATFDFFQMKVDFAPPSGFPTEGQNSLFPTSPSVTTTQSTTTTVSTEFTATKKIDGIC